MPRLAAIGPATAEALGGADLVPAVATQEGLLAELPRPAGRVLFAAAEGARPLLPDELGADVVAALPDPRAAAGAASARRPRRARVGVGGAGARGASARDSRSSSIGPETTRAAREAGLDVVAEAEEHTTTGSSRRSPSAALVLSASSARRLGRPCSSRSSPTSGSRTTSSAPATASSSGSRRTRRSSTSRTGSRRRRCCRARSCSRTRCRTCRPASTSPSSTPASAATGGRSRCATPRAGSTSARTTGSCSRPPSAPGIAEAHELANPAYALESVSRTFHGRDLFAPAAAHLARGVAIGELGPPIDPGGARPARAARARVRGGVVHATTLYVDSFGNIALNLTRDDLERVGVVAREPRRARPLRRAVLRRRGANVRRRARGRRDPLRGQLPQHVDRDLERERRRDAARGDRQAAQHPPGLGVELGADSRTGNPGLRALGSRPTREASAERVSVPDVSLVCRAAGEPHAKRGFLPAPSARCGYRLIHGQRDAGGHQALVCDQRRHRER